jgi:two-component system sensor histidine kinase PilS (NtrC family)
LKHGTDQLRHRPALGCISTTTRPFLEVADRGPGIDESHAERIFEPFSRTVRAARVWDSSLHVNCADNGAMLLYERRAGGGSIFRIIFADPQRWEW